MLTIEQFYALPSLVESFFTYNNYVKDKFFEETYQIHLMENDAYNACYPEQFIIQ